MTAITLLSTTATASDIYALTSHELPQPPASGCLTPPGPAPGEPHAAAVAFLPDGVTDTLILQQVVR